MHQAQRHRDIALNRGSGPRGNGNEMPCLRCLTIAGPRQSAAHAGIAILFCDQYLSAIVGGSVIRFATGAPARGRLVLRPFTV
jgi:hypothetical protein